MRILLIVHCYREQESVIRIICARKATKKGWWCIVMAKEAPRVLGDGEMGRWGDGECRRN
ncbi:MAG: hypothetical protein QNJ74_30325 [Trichodesmium sp. MO_231.B1]|nr:hypothetical protein [Trichodesmium sp. MO_231.B1]